MIKIVFITNDKESLSNVKNEIEKRGIINIDVLLDDYNLELSKYDFIERNVKDNKETGFVLDFGNNISRMGSIDALVKIPNKMKRGDMPRKLCLECETPNNLSVKKCKECGSLFIPDDNAIGGYSMRSKAKVLQDKQDKKTTTHEVESLSFEIAISKKNEIKMIKMGFWDENYDNIHYHYLYLDHSGFPKQNSSRFIMRMFKNTKDYYQLGSVGITVQNMHSLLNEHYDNFFKKVKSIQIRPQKDNARFSELKSIKFDD